MTALFCFGGNVKALPDGRVSGYLVQFSDAAHPDVSPQRDFFTKDTDFDLETGNKKSVFYQHGTDPVLATRKLGICEIKMDEVGLWVEAQLDMRDQYEAKIYDMARAGKLGWSSGTASHLVERKSVSGAHQILLWPIAEASLTPMPADPRSVALVGNVKSLAALHLLGRNTKAVADMTISDQISLLQQELNEDFCDDDADPWDMREFRILDVGMVGTQQVCWYTQGWDSDGTVWQRPYTITDGNDVTWGDALEVVRTTRYLPVTESPDAPDADTGNVKGLPFAKHCTTVLDAVKALVERGEIVNGLRIKDGHTLNQGRREDYAAIKTQLAVAQTAVDSLLTRATPAPPDHGPSMRELFKVHMEQQARLRELRRDTVIS